MGCGNCSNVKETQHKPSTQKQEITKEQIIQQKIDVGLY